MTEPAPVDVTRLPITRYRAAQHAFPRHELEKDVWEQRFQGVHSSIERPPMDPLVRIIDAVPLLPEGAALGGWAAAFLLGASDLDGLERDGLTPQPITVCLQPAVQVRPRAGIVQLRSAFRDDEVRMVDDVPVLQPIRTCFDLARRATDLAEAVVGIDAMLRADLIDLDELHDYVQRHPRWRGRPRAQRAANLADRRARSTQESRFRVLWIIDAGLPAPEVNVPLFAKNTGALVAIPDLLDPEAGLVGEFDGGHHRQLEQHTADNAREEELERHGLIVVRATSLDLSVHRRRTVHRLRQSRARGLARDRQTDRWFLP